MAEFEERKKFWHIFYSPLVLIVLLLAFLFMIRAVWRVYDHEKVSSQDRERIEKELSSADRRAATLKGQIDSLETQRGVEDEIRAKFNVAKEGEGVAVIINDANATSVATTSVVKESWWKSFMGF